MSLLLFKGKKTPVVMQPMGCNLELVKYIIGTSDNTDELKRHQFKKNTSESIQQNQGGYKQPPE